MTCKAEGPVWHVDTGLLLCYACKEKREDKLELGLEAQASTELTQKLKYNRFLLRAGDALGTGENNEQAILEDIAWMKSDNDRMSQDLGEKIDIISAVAQEVDTMYSTANKENLIWYIRSKQHQAWGTGIGLGVLLTVMVQIVMDLLVK